jgi:hypothetical protein
MRSGSTQFGAQLPGYQREPLPSPSAYTIYETGLSKILFYFYTTCDVTYQNIVIFKYSKSSWYVVKHPDVMKPSSWGEKEN